MKEALIQFLSAYPVIAPLVFILLRSSSVIIPPIPGLIFDLVGIAVFGPIRGFIYAEAGTMLGGMVAFWIARYFREPVVKRFVSLQKIHKWEKTVSENKKFWTLVLIRLPTNAFFDYISYAAGLTKMRTRTFFFSTLLGNIPVMALLYFFGGIFYQRGFYYMLAFVVMVLIWIFILGKKFYGVILKDAGEKHARKKNS